MLTPEQIDELMASRQKGRNRLAAALKMAGVTQTALGDAIGVQQSYVNRLCAGLYKDIPLETTRSIAQFFGCSIEDLFPSRRVRKVA